jgi:hypothetical protein
MCLLRSEQSKNHVFLLRPHFFFCFSQPVALSRPPIWADIPWDTQISARNLGGKGHPHLLMGIRWHWRISAMDILRPSLVLVCPASWISAKTFLIFFKRNSSILWPMTESCQEIPHEKTNNKLEFMIWQTWIRCSSKKPLEKSYCGMWRFNGLLHWLSICLPSQQQYQIPPVRWHPHPKMERYWHPTVLQRFNRQVSTWLFYTQEM